MNIVENEPTIDVLESRATAERLLEVGGITSDANPWSGSRKRLELARKAEREKQERDEAAKFVGAVSHYRSLLSQLPALQDAFNHTHKRVNETQDGRMLRERLNHWMGSPQGKNWQLERREFGGRETLPHGVTQDDLNKIRSFESAAKDHEESARALQNIDFPLSDLEHQYPILRELRSLNNGF